MKILLIHNTYKSNSIGGEDLVFESEKLALSNNLGEDNVYSYQVYNDKASFFDFVLNVFYSKKSYNTVYNIVKNNDIDIVHIHNFFPLLSVSVFMAAKAAGAKVIHTIHNYRFWCINGMLYQNNYGVCHKCTQHGVINGVKNKCYRNSMFQSIIATVAFSIYRLLNYDKYIDNYFVLTEFEKEMVTKLGIEEKKLILKPNFVKLYNRKSNEPDCKKDFVFVGRLEYSKGIIELINTWKELGYEYQLTIIGTGPLQSEIEYFQADNIRYLGKMTNEDTLKIISKSKYLLQTSLWYETFGLTIVEAFSVGTPVIAFNIGTRKDFIINEYNGFLCDQEQLKETLIKAKEYNNYKELSDNAMFTYQSYKEEVIIKNQVDIYNNIITNKIER
jgi:glycosyltransferase involved in cell wall biosynthesis